MLHICTINRSIPRSTLTSSEHVAHANSKELTLILLIEVQTSLNRKHFILRMAATRQMWEIFAHLLSNSQNNVRNVRNVRITTNCTNVNSLYFPGYTILILRILITRPSCGTYLDKKPIFQRQKHTTHSSLPFRHRPRGGGIRGSLPFRFQTPINLQQTQPPGIQNYLANRKRGQKKAAWPWNSTSNSNSNLILLTSDLEAGGVVIGQSISFSYLVYCRWISGWCLCRILLTAPYIYKRLLISSYFLIYSLLPVFFLIHSYSLLSFFLVL